MKIRSNSPIRRCGKAAAAAASALFCAMAGASTYEVVHSFDGYDGLAPIGGLVVDAAGTVYGTTPDKESHRKGANPGGTLFKIAGGKFTTLQVFHDSTGRAPAGTLILDAAGNVYGTAQTGGPGGAGTVFKYSEQGGLEVLASFGIDAGGGTPTGGPVMDADGMLYGTTRNFGDACSCGTIWKLDPNTHVLTTLHRFNGTDGSNSEASLVLRGHTLYGTTTSGGPGGKGTVFTIGTDGTGFADIPPTDDHHTFLAGLGGADASGNLWGAAVEGGNVDVGGLFRIDAANVYHPAFDFHGRDGDWPSGTPIVARDGKVYGTTFYGGSKKADCSCGTVYAFDPATGTLETLHSFKGRNDGAEPAAGLAEAPDGSLYGVTFGSGGPYNRGVVFRIVP